MTQEQVDPRLQYTYYLSMSVLKPEDQEEANLEGQHKFDQDIIDEDMERLEGGFLFFNGAPPDRQWQLFREQTDDEDVFRCLLNEGYVDQFKKGVQFPPVSPFWRERLENGGFHIFDFWAKKFRQIGNRYARSVGFDTLGDLLATVPPPGEESAAPPLV